jgi:hypothetical protein
MWGSSPTDVYAVGDGILHYDGAAWSEVYSGDRELRGVWGSSSSDIYVVGDFGTILHFDGEAWSPMDSGTHNNFTAVAGDSAGNVFAVGGGTILYHAAP